LLFSKSYSTELNSIKHEDWSETLHNGKQWLFLCQNKLGRNIFMSLAQMTGDMLML